MLAAESDSGRIDEVNAGMGDAVQAESRAQMDTPGLVRSTLPVAAYAPIFALGAVAVETVAAIYSGSYISWGVVMLAAGFWAVAAAVGGLVLSAVLMPILLAIKGRHRLVVMPDLFVAIGAGLTAHNVADDYSRLYPLGGGVLLNWAFLPAWAMILGSLTAWLVATEKRGNGRFWIAYALAATLFAEGMSAFSGKLAACTLTITPFVLLAIGAYLVRKTRFGQRPALFVVSLIAALAAMLLVGAEGLGAAPAKPIDRGFTLDAGKAAMLAGKPNVVIIVIDTLRADHTTMCGYKYPTTPNLEQLARECQFFPNGETVDSWTLPSHASMFTGLYPREHGARASSDSGGMGVERSELFSTPLARSKQTLATYLSKAGYDTGAIAANYIWLYRAFGLSQGFSYYYDLPRLLIFTPSGLRTFIWPLEVTDTALGLNGTLLKMAWDAKSVTGMGDRWLQTHSRQPFFLFLNYMDVHSPYAAPPPYDHIDGPISYNRIMREEFWRGFVSNYVRTGQGLRRKVKAEITNQYDGGIAYADHWVGEFVRRLKARDLYDNTLLVVTSDHGEFCGEHARLGHALGVYEGGLHIPILVKYPKGRHAGEVRRERVSITGIFATVLDTLGLPVPQEAARPLGAPERVIFAEDFENPLTSAFYGREFRGNRTAIYDGDWKYIHSTTARGELYDLGSDPDEKTNMCSARPDVAARLKSELNTWQRARPLFDGRKEAGAALSESELERLRSLGYLAR